MENFLLGLVLIILLLSFTFDSWKEKAKNSKADFEQKLKSLPDFDSTQQVLAFASPLEVETYAYNSGIALDERRKKLCLITTGDKFNSWRIIPYKDILSVELFEDGNSITKAVRSSQIGSAALGGLLLGGVGAIVGGLSGKTKSSTTTNRIELRLIINEVNNPLHDVIFLNVEAKKKDTLYIKSMQLARHWHGIFEVILKQTENETILESKEINTPPKLTNVSVADEIKKLADLQSAGVLTLEEFQQQKAKLLSD